MKHRYLMVSVILTLFALTGILSPKVVEVQSERSVRAAEMVSLMEARLELQRLLFSRHGELPAERWTRVEMSPAELQDIWNDECEDCGKIKHEAKRVRIGKVKPIGWGLNFRDMSLAGLQSTWRPFSHGLIKKTDSGGFVWMTKIEAPGASGLRVHFGDVHLPKGTGLYVYNGDGQAFGPYTFTGPGHKGDFWSHTVAGSELYVQLSNEGPVSDRQIKAIRLAVRDLGFISARIYRPFAGGEASIEGLCPDNAWCVVDASCYNSGPVNVLKDAVAYTQYVSGPWIYLCSGGLLADTDTGTQIPYFLTANHCLSKQRNANSLECYFQYKTDSCDGACYDPVGVCPRTLGADILSTESREGDYSFLRLWEDPPAGSAFLGWTSTPVAYTHGLNLYRVSHPQGSPQAYSEHLVDTTKGVCSSWPRGKWIYSHDILGGTEGGSSGSPVVNGSAQVVGQLSGGCGTNVNDPCDADSNATVDGAFAHYYPSVQQWLDPGEIVTMHVQSIVLTVVPANGPFNRAVAEVTVVDQDGLPVSGATVTGTFTGGVSGSGSAVTNESGVAVVQSPKVKGTIASFTFCVDDVTHATFIYNSSDNVETCDTY
jgi:V8-like Glu-specific endopeptidase